MRLVLFERERACAPRRRSRRHSPEHTRIGHPAAHQMSQIVRTLPAVPCRSERISRRSHVHSQCVATVHRLKDRSDAFNVVPETRGRLRERRTGAARTRACRASNHFFWERHGHGGTRQGSLSAHRGVSGGGETCSTAGPRRSVAMNMSRALWRARLSSKATALWKMSGAAAESRIRTGSGPDELSNAQQPSTTR